ncbi:MAG: 4Fe-4S dicluster domain-containing protein [Bacteroidia bacterium]|nr:4Fe-4S dicluster domain-containing protein [Bacteroidia bacterium]
MEENSNNQKAYLYDNTKCIGCRACQVACKQWKNLPAEKTEFFGGPGYQNPAKLSSSTFTLIKYHEEVEEDKLKDWVFFKEQCRHCLEPACVSACLVKALEKTPEGPVIYHENLCMGCRYCMISCPFDIPKFQYHKVIPLIQKCNYCYDRLEEGLLPACSQTCPSGAIKFGTRGELIEEARERIFKNPDRYVNHIYGEHEVGGTSTLCISSVPLEKFGVRDVGTTPIPSYSKQFLTAVPVVIIGAATFCTALYWIAKRREAVAEAENKTEIKEE